MYKAIEETSSEWKYTVRVSYLEIYNEEGYDLLDDRPIKTIDDLQRVTVLEDNTGNIILRNLSTHELHSEEEAMQLLHRGDCNRTIGETPMNMVIIETTTMSTTFKS